MEPLRPTIDSLVARASRLGHYPLAHAIPHGWIDWREWGELAVLRRWADDAGDDDLVGSIGALKRPLSHPYRCALEHVLTALTGRLDHE
jgi:hypothetical protein